MRSRNYSIDILKFICAVLVVILHTDCRWHNAILPLTRCAVPCFLMISGFLLYDGQGIDRERLLRSIRHILHIMLWSTLLFIVAKELMSVVHEKTFFVPSLRQWLDFAVLNENPFGFHLWYLGAYLYVLLIMMVVDKYNLWRLFLALTPVLLLSDLAFGKYSLLLFDHEYPYFYVRNFLFVGIPYFMIGAWLKVHIDKALSISKITYWGG